MKPQDIRLRVLEEHARLREMLDELDALNKRFEEREEVGAAIRELGVGLFEVFAAHLTLEDTLLAPLLAELPGEGPEVADRLKLEHDEQRAMLRYLLRRIEEAGRPTSLVSNELRSFSDYLRRDMHYEEETLLPEHLLEPAEAVRSRDQPAKP